MMCRNIKDTVLQVHYTLLVLPGPLALAKRSWLAFMCICSPTGRLTFFHVTLGANGRLVGSRLAEESLQKPTPVLVRLRTVASVGSGGCLICDVTCDRLILFCKADFSPTLCKTELLNL